MTIIMDERPITEIDQKVPQVFLFFGIALLILGLIAIAASFAFTVATVMLIGVVLLAAGVAELIHAFAARTYKNVGFNIVSGIIYLAAGALLLARPILGALGLTLVLGLFFLMAGITRLAYATTHKQQRHFGWFVLGGVVDVILAALIFLGFPATGLWVIGLFVGIEMILHGASWIALSTIVNNMRQGISRKETEVRGVQRQVAAKESELNGIKNQATKKEIELGSLKKDVNREIN